LFLQDKAAPHKAATTHQKVADLHSAVLKYPAYSPDLAPSDYYLFPNLFIKSKTYQPPSYIKDGSGIWLGEHVFKIIKLNLIVGIR
jgi:hypothetical protein